MQLIMLPVVDSQVKRLLLTSINVRLYNRVSTSVGQF